MTDNSSSPDPVENEQPLLTHLIEMRDRLLRAVITILVIFVVLYTFSTELFELVAKPYLQTLVGSKMISTGPIDPFFTPMKLALALSIFAAMPVILYQGWAFVAPGLYQHEKRLVAPLLVSSVILFYAGMAFAYFVVLPLLFNFMGSIVLPGVETQPDIGRYLDIVLKLFFAFGIAFEVPVATVLLNYTGMTTPESLAQKRPYIIVGAFVVGMMLTPPDIISQTLLAVPMWLLFEVGLIASRYFLRLKREREEEIEEEDDLETDEDMEAELDRYEEEERANRSSPNKDGES
jgi:sec-independent protein translocase protein TatC